MGNLLSELGRATRFAIRHPGFALAAVLTLALGIGASSTVFTLLYALTVRPLSYANADGVFLVQGWDEARNESGFGIPLAAFVALRADTDAFADLAAYRYWSAGLSGDGTPERVQAYRVTGETLPLLGRAALLGRVLGPRDARPSAPRAALLSHGLWQRRFGSERDVVGQEIRLDGETYTVVGVVGNVRHSSLAANPAAEVYVPMAHAPESMMMLTLRTSVDPLSLVAPARAAILALDPDQPIFRVSALDRKVAEALLLPGMEAALFGVLGGAALFLAALGLYGLLSFVVSQRTSELGLRMALGATPAHVVRQVVGGSLRLVAPGLVLGAVLAAALGRALRGLFFQANPLNPRVHAAMVGLLAAVALLAAAVPAARAARIDPARALHEEQVTGGERRSGPEGPVAGGAGSGSR